MAAMTVPKSLYSCKEYSIRKFVQIKYSGYENQDVVQVQVPALYWKRKTIQFSIQFFQLYENFSLSSR